MVGARRRSQDAGSITVLVLGLILSFMAAAGLAVDGGRLVAARITVSDHAENAARVGAQQVGSMRSGRPILRDASARSAALSYLASHGLSGEVAVGARTITVTTRITQSTALLRLVGIFERTVAATRTAEIVTS